MKIITITTTLILILLNTLPSFGEVEFKLIFTDSPGTGLLHKEHEWMRQEAENAVQSIGPLFKQNAVVTLNINATEKTSYAWAPTEHYYIKEEKYGKKIIPKAQYKILNNITTEDGEPDGHIEFNVSKFSREKSEEFRLTFIHELTHVLGFLNSQDPTKSELTYYTDFDKLLHDKNGNPLLTHSKDSEGDYYVNPKFNGALELFACGPSIRKQNGGKYIKIYNPTIYEAGSSFTHIDGDFHPRSIMTSHKCCDEYKVWNNCELGILQEIGYEIDWENYNKVFCKLYPLTVTVNIDKEILNETDSHVEVIPNSDFPQKCDQKNIMKNQDLGDVLAVKINRESRLILVDNKTKSHLFEIKPYVKNLLKTVVLKNKKYKLNLADKILNNNSEINIKLFK